MLNVMRVDIAGIAAARESTAFVARAQRALQGRWDASCFAANAERFAVLVLDDGDNARVTGKPTRSFRSDVRAILDLTSPRASHLQRFDINVHDYLMFITATHRRGTILQEALG